MDGLTLVPASQADIPAITRLAEKIWFQHYPAIISEKQIRYMLDKMYSTQSLQEQMSAKQHQFFLIQKGGNSLGFISVHNTSGHDWFLNKFYIDQEQAAKGLGSEAFRRLLKIISPLSIQLTVNRQNYKAINFYFKNGFVIKEVADFDIGDGYEMNDFVMEYKDR